MACYPQKDIAEAVNVGQATIADFIGSVLENQTDKISDSDDDADDSDAKPSAFAKRGMSPAALHQTDFEVPL